MAMRVTSLNICSRLSRRSILTFLSRWSGNLTKEKFIVFCLRKPLRFTISTRTLHYTRLTSTQFKLALIICQNPQLSCAMIKVDLLCWPISRAPKPSKWRLSKLTIQGLGHLQPTRAKLKLLFSQQWLKKALHTGPPRSWWIRLRQSTIWCSSVNLKRLTRQSRWSYAVLYQKCKRLQLSSKLRKLKKLSRRKANWPRTNAKF